MAIAIDDEDPRRLLRLFNTDAGCAYLKDGAGLDPELIEKLSWLGISGIANVLCCIKMAKYYELSSNDVLVTVLTDSAAMYGSRIRELGEEDAAAGKTYTGTSAMLDHHLHILGLKTDNMLELTYPERKRVHNLKYYTWVEQQGKTAEELDALWALLKQYMIEERPTFMENNIRLKVLGRRDRIPEDTVQEMEETLRLTATNTGLTLALAINYGARQEIVDAIRSVARDLVDPEKRDAALRAAGVDSIEELIDEKLVSSRLYDSEAPDPDLFIRTGGELRLSNYLLWQLSYAELWFTDLLWPDFTAETLKEAIQAFQRRRRRYGGLDDDSSESRV